MCFITHEKSENVYISPSPFLPDTLVLPYYRDIKPLHDDYINEVPVELSDRHLDINEWKLWIGKLSQLNSQTVVPYNYICDFWCMSVFCPWCMICLNSSKRSAILEYDKKLQTWAYSFNEECLKNLGIFVRVTCSEYNEVSFFPLNLQNNKMKMIKTLTFAYTPEAIIKLKDVPHTIKESEKGRCCCCCEIEHEYTVKGGL